MVQAIRNRQRFFVLTASPQGGSSGWFEADFRKRPDGSTVPDSLELKGIFEFPVPGIPFSNIHTRFDASRRERFNDSGAEEIPLWPEPISDFWSLMHERTPWAGDLLPKDRAKAEWGHQSWKCRHQAASKIQVIIDRQRFDGAGPHFDPLGVPQPGSAVPNGIGELALSYPNIGRWLAAVAGPAPDARLAHEAVVAILREPAALFVCMYGLLMKDFGDRVLEAAILTSFTTALLDAGITNHGTLRPSFAGDNVNRTIELFAAPIDLDSPPDAIQGMWVRVTSDWQELFRTHEFLGSTDFPMDLLDLRDTFRGIALDGDLEDTELRLQVLLQEAQEARQWSIPWGARVQLQLGPFRMLRVFELDGEFRCLFLDDRQRYFQVSLNLATNPPEADSTIIPSKTSDSATDREAEAIVKVIAAAIVRDFLVVEERESLFHVRRTVNRPGDRQSQSVVYLPRVRYTPSVGMAIPPTGEVAARVRHQVSAHLRRSGNASASQRILALRYGLQIPQGFTFVTTL